MFNGASSKPLPLLYQLVFLGEKFREGLHAAVGPASSSSSSVGGVAHVDKQRQIDALLQRLCKVSDVRRGIGRGGGTSNLQLVFHQKRSHTTPCRYSESTTHVEQAGPAAPAAAIAAL
jgi:hypothetical protein